MFRVTRNAVFVGWLGAAVVLSAQVRFKDTEWPTHSADLAGSRYRPLDQINASNFNKLEIAWHFRTESIGNRPEFKLEGTPLMINGVLYATAGSRRAAVGLDAASGELLWVHGEHEGARGAAAPRQLSGRGLAYWTDGKEERILYVTPGYRLICLDAKTGGLVKTFGKDGVVDLKLDDDQTIALIDGEIGLQSAPIVAKETIIIGAAFREGMTAKSMHNNKGFVRGFDVRTGKRLWIFHTIPKPGEFGYNTWENDSADYTGNTGVWGQISVDEELGMVYLPVEMPTGDYFGGHRPGNGLFGESIVALDLKTGQRKWHYQLVHHGIWDWDIPCAPILVNFTFNGQTVKALAQPTKQSILYVFDRLTGKPIWPIEEKPVAISDVPGEKSSPTQPFPAKPPAYGRNGTSVDELIDFTPELRAEAMKVAARYKLGPLFTPPVVSKLDGPLATLVAGCCQGGTNWPGGSYDPETHMVYVFTQGAVNPLGLLPADPAKSDMTFTQGIARPASEPAAPPAGEGGGNAPTVQGLPLFKPPYGLIAAINLDKGEIAWQTTHGDTPDNIRNHPALKGLNIPRTGRPGVVGVITTKTLVIAGERGTITNDKGEKIAKLRAYDKATGKDAGAVLMPAGQTGAPMTYMAGGKQYIVIAVGGPGFPGEFVAYTLP